MAAAATAAALPGGGTSDSGGEVLLMGVSVGCTVGTLTGTISEALVSISCETRACGQNSLSACQALAEQSSN